MRTVLLACVIVCSAQVLVSTVATQETPIETRRASYFLDYQYPHHIAYITAMEAISGLRLCEAIELSIDERTALEQEGRTATTKAEIEQFCALWLLRKLSC